MDFGEAIKALVDGKFVTRDNEFWEGSYVALITPEGSAEICHLKGKGDFILYPFFVIKTVYGNAVVWTPNTGDVLAQVWKIV